VAELDECSGEDLSWLSGFESHFLAENRSDFENWLQGGLSWQIAFSLPVSIYRAWVDGVHQANAATAVRKPRLMVSHGELAESLRRRPELIFSLSPRQFEALVADLLFERGREVHLTPSTRDGGRDILAYRNTGITRVLCLVETKQYRKNRFVGVGAVRQLYGVLHDNDASQAMIVTTSSFTAGARALQSRHPYQLSLHDGAALRQWIQGIPPRAARGD
jgi:hypothetical protein